MNLLSKVPPEETLGKAQHTWVGKLDIREEPSPRKEQS
jgi:hypothetical protein